MVVLDTTVLLLLVAPNASPPLEPVSGKPLSKCKDRIEFLLHTLSNAGTQVLVPTPVLAETLVRAGSAKAQYLTAITGTYALRIASFDQRAAVELAMLLESDLKASVPRTPTETKAKLKFDRQIVAIAKVHGVKQIYSDDRGLTDVAENNGIAVTHTWQLPLPPVHPQHELDLVTPGQAMGEAAKLK